MNIEEITTALHRALDHEAALDLAKRLGHSDLLSYAAVDCQSIAFDFVSETYGDGPGASWEVLSHPSIEDQIEEAGDIELPDGSTLEIDEAGDITGTAGPDLASKLGIDYDEEDQPEIDVRRGKDGWKQLFKHFGLDEDIFDEDAEDNQDQWQPMYNRAWPLPMVPGDDWHRKMDNMTVVLIDSEPHLALTGCGMDMSWEIASTFVKLGYYPPASIRLPAMARCDDPRDLALIEAMRESQRHQAAGALQAILDLDMMEARMRERTAKATA